ncbi:MAG: N4-gp56 family major capsid protein [Selenomonadaceae bacterium]|nr:N4-gp56 family major capsid protein [Selenomonadaceae bacterium]
MGASDTFSTALIVRAKRIALADENTMVKPIMINGLETYIMVIDQWQARDLKNDQTWIEAQQYANVRGNDNPIFSGALGVYDGVVLHQCNRIQRTETGSGGTKVGHALFLGRQAAVFAVGTQPTWNEKTFDYGNKIGFEFGRIFGIKKTQFKYDGTNQTDFGCINVLTASEDDPS